MTFLAPLFLAAAGLAALLVAALHLFARHRPPRRFFPTARFVPDREARAASFSPRLTDRRLLAMRIAALVLAGAALARPVATATEREAGRVILADRSRAVGDIDELRDSVVALLEPGDVLVAFADSTRIIAGAARDSAAVLERIDRRGSLSAALVAAGRAAREVSGAATVELVLVSPLVRETLDAATEEIRAAWPGPLRIVPVAAREAADPAEGRREPLTVRGAADDPVVIAASLGSVRPEQPVRIVRGSPSAADSAWARDSARVLVHWPESSAPPAWTAGPGDVAGDAVAAGAAVLIAPLQRLGSAPDGYTATPVAWWLDGRTAAAEHSLGSGCVREVGMGVPGAGDLALRPELRRVLAELAVPCGGPRGWDPLDEATLGRLAGEGRSPDRLELHRLETLPAPLVPWLLAGALALLLLELVMRRQAGARS